jgi:hypothetical protein
MHPEPSVAGAWSGARPCSRQSNCSSCVRVLPPSLCVLLGISSLGCQPDPRSGATSATQCAGRGDGGNFSGSQDGGDVLSAQSSKRNVILMANNSVNRNGRADSSQLCKVRCLFAVLTRIVIAALAGPHMRPPTDAVRGSNNVLGCPAPSDRRPRRLLLVGRRPCGLDDNAELTGGADLLWQVTGGSARLVSGVADGARDRGGTVSRLKTLRASKRISVYHQRRIVVELLAPDRAVSRSRRAVVAAEWAGWALHLLVEQHW